MEKLKSRKFILAIASQIIAFFVLLVPEHGDTIRAVATDAVALLVSLGTALGYIVAEAKVDAASLHSNSTHTHITVDQRENN